MQARSTCSKSVKIVDLPGLPEKGDVSDYRLRGRTLRRLILPDDFTTPSFVVEPPPFSGELPPEKAADQPGIMVPPHLFEPGLEPRLMLLPLHEPPASKSTLLECREMGQDELAEHELPAYLASLALLPCCHNR